MTVMLGRSMRLACVTSVVVFLSVGRHAPGSEVAQPGAEAAESSAKERANDQDAQGADSVEDIDRHALEKEFEQTMTGARLKGYWQMTGEDGLTDKGALTEPRKESYVVSKVSKMGEGSWLVFAQITFADKDVNVPVPVRVVWAGDTAIITLDDVGVPLIGTYSARVMIHKGFYSGIWYSNVKNYGGVMAGKIMRADDDTPPASDSSP